MTTGEPLTPDDIERLRRNHRVVQVSGRSTICMHGNTGAWPCDAAILLAELDRLATVARDAETSRLEARMHLAEANDRVKQLTEAVTAAGITLEVETDVEEINPGQPGWSKAARTARPGRTKLRLILPNAQ